MARPHKPIDDKLLISIMRMKPTLFDVSAIMKLSKRTIERHIKATYGQTFDEFRDQHMVETKFNIIRKAIEKAEAGDNVMLIFCLKNLCKWVDKQPEEVPTIVQNVENTQVNMKQARETVLEFKKLLTEAFGSGEKEKTHDLPLRSDAPTHTV